MYVHVGGIVLVRCSSTQCCVSLQQSEYSRPPSPSPSVLFHVFYLFFLPPLSLSSIFQQFTLCLSRTVAALDVHNMDLYVHIIVHFIFFRPSPPCTCAGMFRELSSPSRCTVASTSCILRVRAHATTLWVCALLPPHACVSL